MADAGDISNRGGQIDTIVPLRRNIDLYANAIGLTRLPGFAWEPHVHVPLTTPPSPPSAASTAPGGPQTRLGLGRSLLSWSQCPVPLTAVVNREHDEHGPTQDWVLVSTSNNFTEAHIRFTYELRPAIEERHRQYKCFWELTRRHSCAFSLVVNQALFVLLAYTLVQAQLVLRPRQELTCGVWERTWQLLSPTLEVVAMYSILVGSQIRRVMSCLPTQCA